VPNGDLNRVFDKLGALQESVEGRIEKLDSKMGQKLDALDRKFDVKTDTLRAQIGNVAEHLATVHACAEDANERSKCVEVKFNNQREKCAEKFGGIRGVKGAVAMTFSIVAVLAAVGTLIWRLLS